MDYLTNKKLILLTAILVFLGTATIANGTTPDITGPLWEHIWKVEEPVSIEGTEAGIPVNVTGSIQVEAGSEPIEVTLDEPVEVEGTISIEEEVSVNVENEVTLDPDTKIGLAGRDIVIYDFLINVPTDTLFHLDVSGAKSVHIYLSHSKRVRFDYDWYLVDPDSSSQRYYPVDTSLPGDYDGEGMEEFHLYDVTASHLELELIVYEEETDIRLWAYVSPV